ncbi:O-antigen ligase family protein [Phreatobacter sp. AB_2022a]|uniref:O-antigen ligase family protein n=1 Tax=Phreatobacter sp. AB_2022a TaxID=3003134 RepID=UPI002286E769|nr:O-antigen ligase family protein [Phreatobacter sp. AB_2022a]MCZ0737593.1 O-antigen ligase family protein [Phreatobacter sp. AB_2022a]
MDRPTLSFASRAAGWIRATFDDPNRAAFLFAPLLGFLPLPLGSVATLWFFIGAAYVGILWGAGRVRWVWPRETAFGCTVALVYFAVAVLSPVLFPNRLMGLLDVGTTIHFLLFLVLVGAMVQTPRIDVFDLFLHGIRAGAISALIFASIEAFVFGRSRPTAGMANAIPFGDVAILAAGLSLIGFSRLSRLHKVFAIVASAAGLGACLLSQTRGALLALPLIVLALGVYLWPIIRRRTGMTVLALMLVGAAVGGLGLIAKVSDRFVELRSSLADGEAMNSRDPSTAHRAILWTYGAEAFLSRPVLGYGSQNAVSEVRRRAAKDGFDVPPYRHLHNEFITTAVGRGLIGLIALIAVLAAPIIIAVGSVRDDRYRDRVAFAIMLSGGYAIFGMTNLIFSHDQMNTVFMSAYVVLLVAAYQAATRQTAFYRPSLAAPAA